MVKKLKKKSKKEKEEAPAVPPGPPLPEGQDRCTSCGSTWDVTPTEGLENWLTVNVKLPMWSYHDFVLNDARASLSLYKIQRMIEDKHGAALGKIILYNGKIGHSYRIKDVYQSLYDIGIVGGKKEDKVECTIYYDFETDSAPSALLMCDSQMMSRESATSTQKGPTRPTPPVVPALLTPTPATLRPTSPMNSLASPFRRPSTPLSPMAGGALFASSPVPFGRIEEPPKKSYYLESTKRGERVY